MCVQNEARILVNRNASLIEPCFYFHTYDRSCPPLSAKLGSCGRRKNQAFLFDRVIWELGLLA